MHPVVDEDDARPLDGRSSRWLGSPKFSELMAVVTRAMHNFARRHALQPHDCEDVAEEVVLILIRQLKRNELQLRDTEAIMRYAYAVARNTLVDLMKKQAVQRQREVPLHPDTIDDVTAAASEGRTPEDELIAAEKSAVARMAIQHLNPEHRRIVEMRIFENLPPREIAKRLGVDTRRVSNILLIALTAVRTRLEDYENDLVPPGFGLGNDHPRGRQEDVR